MVQVMLSLAGSSYMVGCEQGDEAHVQRLAREVEQRLAAVRAQLMPSDEAHALFLTALFLADELHDARNNSMPETGREIVARAEAVIEERRFEKERMAQAAELAERLVRQLGEHAVSGV